MKHGKLIVLLVLLVVVSFAAIFITEQLGYCWKVEKKGVIIRDEPNINIDISALWSFKIFGLTYPYSARFSVSPDDSFDYIVNVINISDTQVTVHFTHRGSGVVTFYVDGTGPVRLSISGKDYVILVGKGVCRKLTIESDCEEFPLFLPGDVMKDWKDCVNLEGEAAYILNFYKKDGDSYFVYNEQTGEWVQMPADWMPRDPLPF